MLVYLLTSWCQVGKLLGNVPCVVVTFLFPDVLVVNSEVQNVKYNLKKESNYYLNIIVKHTEVCSPISSRIWILQLALIWSLPQHRRLHLSILPSNSQNNKNSYENGI